MLTVNDLIDKMKECRSNSEMMIFADLAVRMAKNGYLSEDEYDEFLEFNRTHWYNPITEEVEEWIWAQDENKEEA